MAKAKNPKRVAAGKKSRRKGSANENQLAKLFKGWWGEGKWARTPSSGGWATPAHRESFRTCGDIITTDTVFPYCIEAKKEEGWDLDQLLTAPRSRLYRWWDQVTGETPEGMTPMLVAGRNRRERLVVTPCLLIEEWASMYPALVPHMSMCLEEHHVVILSLKSLFSINANWLKVRLTDGTQTETDSTAAA